jgi:UDP-GlcNAc3NAcA epimerase
MKKVVTIVGARPQFIKLAPFSKELRKSFSEVIIHTGQHYDTEMSASFFGELGIPAPDHQLSHFEGGQGRQTGRMLEAIEKVLLEDRPDFVVVFGDTNSTLAGTLAAAKLGIPTAHVEAGLRSYNRAMPEEINRLVADHTSTILFAPTAAAVENLNREGLSGRTYLTGDIMVDVVQANRGRAEVRTGILGKLGLRSNEFSLLTLHRPYTVDDPATLVGLLEALAELDEPILFPVHPRTRNTLTKIGYPFFGEECVEAALAGGGWRGKGPMTSTQTKTGSLRLVGPVGYLDFVCLQSHARRIMTDSGGIQKEAYLLGKPCITLRPETEWIETVEAGWNLLLPPGSLQIATRIREFKPPSIQPPVFGENVAAQMVAVIREQF